MNNRKAVIKHDDILELISPLGVPAVKIRVITGANGNTQCLIYPQPGTRCHYDPPASTVPHIVKDSPADVDDWYPGQNQ